MLLMVRAAAPPKGVHPDTLLDEAGVQLYRDRHAGRGRAISAKDI